VPREPAHRRIDHDRRRLRRCEAQGHRRRRESGPIHPLMVERVLGIILPVFSIIALGWLYGRRAKPDMEWVNRISMNVLAPALIFSALASKDFDIYANGRLILGGIGIVLGSGLLAWPVARWLGVDSRTFVPPMMFNNCGNMGLP